MQALREIQQRIEGLTHAFGKHASVDHDIPTKAIAPPEHLPVPNSLVTKENLHIPTLPFDIKISDGGRTIERIGEPIEPASDYRVFILRKGRLQRFLEHFQKNHGRPDEYYSFLKKEGIAGRRFATDNNPVMHLPEADDGHVFIIKKIKHLEKGEREVSEIGRFELTPDGPRMLIVDRILDWHEGEPLDLFAAIADVPFVQFKERAIDMKAPLTKSKLDRDPDALIPGTNTIMIRGLRRNSKDSVETMVAARLIPTPEGVSFQILREPNDYDTISGLSRDNEFVKGREAYWKSRGWTLEQAVAFYKNFALGPNGILCEGEKDIRMFNGKHELTVPLTRGQHLTVFSAAGTAHRGELMQMVVQYDEFDRLCLVRTGGIEPHQRDGDGDDAVLIYKFEKAARERDRLRKAAEKTKREAQKKQDKENDAEEGSIPQDIIEANSVLVSHSRLKPMDQTHSTMNTAHPDQSSLSDDITEPNSASIDPRENIQRILAVLNASRAALKVTDDDIKQYEANHQ